jgi:NAD(P)-dependent dehydrogenase (short-subunit alcohol dehydrogenase family)
MAAMAKKVDKTLSAGTSEAVGLNPGESAAWKTGPEVNLKRRHFLGLSAAGAAAITLPGCSESEFTVSPDTRLPQGEFGADSTAEDVTAGMDLSGKVALVTGSTSGLGLETLRVLSLRGAHVIATGRTVEKAATACKAVGGLTTPVALELSDFDSVVNCARQVAGMGLNIDMLVCNAGINTFGDLELINGVERMFVVNHLGHFVLVNHLLPLLHAAPAGRIVHVGSRSAYGQAPPVGIDFDNLRGEKIFDAGQAYGRSKLANTLFSLELAQQLEGSGTTSNVIHPGLVQTNIARTAPAFLRGAFDLFGGLVAKSPEQGAATQTFAATHPSLEGVSGAYFEDCNPVLVSGPQHMTDAPMAKQLWAVSQEMTSDYLI